MHALAHRLEQLNRWIGSATAWLTLGMVLATAVIVVERYLLQSGSIRLQESVTFMHALVFMLAAAYTLAAGDHVRVDIFYGRMTPQQQAWVNVLGTVVLLIPFCGFLLWSSWDYVATSWQIRESSQEAGGLPYPFPALMKSCIPLTAVLLSLQGVVMVLRGALTLRSASAPVNTGD